MRVARRLPLSILIIGLGVTASCRSDSLISPSTLTQQPSNDGTAPTLKPSYVSCDVNMTSTRRHGNPNGVYTQTDGVQYLNVVVIQGKRGWLPADLFYGGGGGGSYDPLCSTGGGGSPPPTNGESDADLCAEVQIDVNAVIAETGGTAEDLVNCPDCLVDFFALAADWHDIRTNGLNCQNGIAAGVDVIAAVIPGLPAVFGTVERGVRNSIIREALQRGREAHAGFKTFLRDLGHMAEVVLPSRKRIDGVIIDHANRYG